jgi:HNH endonuclease
VKYDATRRRLLMLDPVANAERFWRRVEKGEGCWPWRGAVDKHGYGWCRAFGRSAFAHRVAWRLIRGAWPMGVLRHTCDNPICVNPSHLIDGTQRDNMRDMAIRGRACRGEKRSKIFRDEDIHEIRRLVGAGVTLTSIAKRYGVDASCIRKIARRTRWAHIGAA